MKKIESEQLANTPSENIKYFEVEGNKVKAVFWNAKGAVAYIKKYSVFAFTPTWYDKIGFADFTVHYNEIHAYSNYHSTYSMIKMFENGLKNF